MRAGAERRARRRAARNDRALPWQPVLLGLVVLLTAAPALVAPSGQAANGYSPDIHIAAYVQVLGMATLALLAVALMRHRKPLRLPRSSVLLPLTLIVAWAGLSTLWSVNRYDAMHATLIWAGAWLAAVLVLLIADGEAAQRRLLTAIAAAAVPVALLAMLQYLFGVAWIEQHERPSGTLGNKNMLGQYVALTMPVTFGLFVVAQRRPWIWGAATATACMAAAMVYTNSRAAWVVLLLEALLAAGVLAWLRLRRGYRPLPNLEKKLALAFMAALFAALSALSPVGSSAAPAFSRYASRAAVVSGTFGNRYAMWRNSAPMWREHWLLGVGIGNWQNWYEQYQSSYRQDQVILGTQFHIHAHNDYVQFACQLGVVGLGLLGWLGVAAVLLFRRVLRASASAPDGGERPEPAAEPNSVLMVWPMIGLLGVSTSALVSFPFQQPIAILLVMAYLAILSLHDARVRGLPPRELKLPPRPVRAAIAALLIVLTVGVAVGRYRLHVSEFHNRAAQGHLIQQQFADAERHARIALRYDPGRTLLKWFLATSILTDGNPEEALAVFDEVLAVRPYWASAIGNRGFALASLGRHLEAAEGFARLAAVRDASEPRRDRLHYLLAGNHHQEALPAAFALRDWYAGKIADCLAAHEAEPAACDDTRTANQAEIDALAPAIADLERIVGPASSEDGGTAP